ncbi:MAG: DUF4468 domain-containing protein [Paraprevotella sp.]|nr:DUF4468 domain-containing protein [Paraprevotella sp.]
MKKIYLILSLCLGAISTNAQIMRMEELETYAKEKYGEKWVEAAENLGSTLVLDKNNSLTYIQIIDCGEATKEQIYLILNHWFTATFNDANSVITFNDKDLGCIIGEGYLDGIAAHMGGMNNYAISARPIIKIDIKDKKIRVTYTIQCYQVKKTVGGGITAALMGGTGVNISEKWALEKCYPFVTKDKHKKSSSKALVMVHAYSNVIMDKIEEAVKNGLIGNENDNW